MRAGILQTPAMEEWLFENHWQPLYTLWHRIITEAIPVIFPLYADCLSHV